MTVEDNFCVLPFLHVVYNPYDSTKSNCSAKPCCRIQNSFEFDTIDPIKKSKIWTDLQNQFLKNQKPEVCSHCWTEEELGQLSYRNTNNEQFQHVIKSKTYLHRELKYLELMMGNACNLSCRMCNETFSSKWNPINQFLKANNQKIYKGNQTSYTDWRTLDLSKLENLKLMGGEPLYNKDTFLLLEYLIENNLHKQINLSFPTNATIFPNQDWLKYLNQFQSVSINISIDGYGSLNDYIRHDSSWEVVNENVKRYVDYGKRNSKLTLSTNTVVTLYNVNNLEKLNSYFIKNKIQYTFFDIASFPNYLHIGILPNELRESIKSTTIDKVRSFFKLSPPTNYDLLDEFKVMTALLDQYHNKNFQDYNPSMYSLLYK